MEYLLTTDKNKVALQDNISNYLNSRGIVFNNDELRVSITLVIQYIVKYYDNSILQGDIREQLVYYNKVIFENVINKYIPCSNLNECIVEDSNDEHKYLIGQQSTNQVLSDNFVSNLKDCDIENNDHYSNNEVLNFTDLEQQLNTDMTESNKIFKGNTVFNLDKMNWSCNWKETENGKYYIEETPYNKICLNGEINDVYNTNIVTEIEGAHKTMKIHQIDHIILDQNTMKVVMTKRVNSNDFSIQDELIFKGLKCVIEDKEPFTIDHNYNDFINYLEANSFFVKKIVDGEDHLVISINNFINIDGKLLIKGSCLNKSKIPQIKMSYEIKYP